MIRLRPLRNIIVQIREIAWSIIIICLIFVGVSALYTEAFTNSPHVEFNPIQVPPSLAETGVTARVAAQHLIDHVYDIRHAANTDYKPGEMKPAWLKPDLNLPAAGLSIQAAASYFRSLYQRVFADTIFAMKPTRVVSGELITRGCDYCLSLHLRIIEGDKILETANITGLLHRVFLRGAHQIVETVEPYTLAAYYYSRDDYARSRQLSADIVEKPKNTEAAVRAINLLGLLDTQDANYEDAIEKYERATKLNPEFAAAYYNWGYALSSLEKYRNAIPKYERATELESSFADAYFQWGVALLATGETDGAIKKYKKAIQGNRTKYGYLEDKLDIIKTF